MAGIIKKYSDYSGVSVTDARKFLVEGATPDVNDYTEGSDIIAYIATKTYKTLAEIEALSSLLKAADISTNSSLIWKNAGGSIATITLATIQIPHKGAFGGGYITKTGNTQITISGNISCVDDTGAVKMDIADGFIKDLALAWSEGSGAAKGALDTGTLGDFLLTSLYIIHNSTSGTTDLLCVEDGSSPTMPSGYTYKREIARIFIDTTTVISKIYNFYEMYNSEDMETDFLPFDYLEGFDITVSDATNINISEGSCKDDTGEYDLIYRDNHDTIEKLFTSTWSAGDGGGLLDTGTVADDTIYYIFITTDAATGRIDFVMSTKATAPTLPADHDYKRLIGYLLTADYSGNDEYFVWKVGQIPHIEMDGTSATKDVTLPVINATNDGMVYRIKCLNDTNACTVISSDGFDCGLSSPISLLDYEIIEVQASNDDSEYKALNKVVIS